MNLKEFLEKKFTEWQHEEGSRKTVAEFAEYLGVKQSTISMWWSAKRTPEGENLRKIAIKLGIEIYDILGIPRPEENLIFIETNWEKLSKEEKKEIRMMIEKKVNKKSG